MNQAESFASNVAAGRIGPAEIAQLQKGFSGWLASGGAVPLETCLHLPQTVKGFARANRDAWLRRAWQLTDANEPWLKSCALATELADFSARIWPEWKKGGGPPERASALRSALFMAMKTGARIPASSMRLHTICSAR
ncbi:MAG: hypothetical protein U1A72_19920 [Sulfuritalea sp.]|nr:hypothetical protein [Sulfuritalea sp.]